MPATPAKRILVVDDEEDILRSTRMLLEVMGYEPITVSDAAKVVEVAERERPDLILQDIKMPGLDLPQLVHDLRANPTTRDIPFAFFSASPFTSQTAHELAARGFLTKPFREEQLEVLIQETTRAGEALRHANGSNGHG